MTSVPFVVSASRRSNTPEAILKNAYAEKAATQQGKPLMIRARAGAAPFQTVGAAPVRGLHAKAGLFGGAALVVADTGVHLLSPTGASTALPGTLAGTDPVEIDSGQDADLISIARAATGDALYKITEADGAVLEDFPTTGGAGASSVCHHRGFWFAAEAGTDAVYYQVPGDDAWGALEFASAEYAPDPIVAIRSLGEQVWMLGQASVEGWALTEKATPAIAPYGGLNFDIGCRSRDAAVSLPNALIWVDNTCQVRLTEGGAPQVISDEGLSEQIRNAAPEDLRAGWYPVDGKVFYKLTLGGDSSWVYDLAGRRWATDATAGYAYSRVNQHAAFDTFTVAANGVTNEVYRLDPDARDDAGEAFAVEFMAYAELSEGRASCANIELLCEVGNAPREGQGSAPLIQMRYSDDGQMSWSRWREKSLGVTGQAKRVRWNALGTIKPPGRFFHFRVSDPVGRRFSDLRMNAP